MTHDAASAAKPDDEATSSRTQQVPAQTWASPNNTNKPSAPCCPHPNRHRGCELLLPTNLGGVDSPGVWCVLQQGDPEVQRDVVGGWDLVCAWALGEQVTGAYPGVGLGSHNGGWGSRFRVWGLGFWGGGGWMSTNKVGGNTSVTPAAAHEQSVDQHMTARVCAPLASRVGAHTNFQSGGVTSHY